ncbi:MAG: IscS subfamily cysteine desulfurase [Gemmataceae bacterium]
MIYLDNNATTRTDPRVVEAMLPYFGEEYGNPASRHHAFGRRAEEAVNAAREQVAALIGAGPREVVFTSGATESDNLAIKGAALAYRPRGNHLVTVQTEHHAVLDPCRRLQREGFDVTFLPTDRYGQVTAGQVEQALTDRTILVSVMAANNEVGTVHPLAEIGAVCKRRGVLFHTDAAQAAGKLPLDVEALGIDLLSLSGHKLYGPKGVGALYVRRRQPTVRLEPLFDGGGHERGIRSGTLNVPGIVGLGKACALCREEVDAERVRLTALRERLRRGIMEALEGVTLNGHPTERLPGNLNLSFDGVRGEALLMGLRNLAVSSGSACTSANPEPSYVLRALGVDDERALASLRFGLGRFTTEAEVDEAVGEVVRVVRQLREMSPDYPMRRQVSSDVCLNR